MKISKNTLNLLSSFSNFNPSIYIRKGNVIATTNVGKENTRVVPIKSVLVRVEVEETFPVDFGIFDLKQFLQVVSTFDNDPDFEFTERYVTISENNNTIRYAFCEENCVLQPNSTSLDVGEERARFIIDGKTLAKIKKVANVMKHDDFFVRTENGKAIEIVLTTVDEGVDEPINEYSVTIETDNEESDIMFNAKFSMKSISALSNEEYDVRVCEYNGRNVLLFEGLGDTKIVYYIAPKR